MLELPGTDLDSIAAQTGELWEQVRGERLFLTGGTGFFGSWMVESFLYANRVLDLKASMVVLTRNPEGFRAARPHLALNRSVTFCSGDVRSFDFPAGHFSHIIHAATPSGGELDSQPAAMLDTIIGGTRRVLDFAVACGARSFLLTSSGAVYGKQPADVTRLAETSTGGPDTMSSHSAYAEGKRTAELLCSIYASAHGVSAVIARCFAFVGPYLPLDAHFAAGNFIRDVLRGGPIRVKGDGSTVRSYLYAADLATWLWTILFRGVSCRPYNVGSDEGISIGELAGVVAGLRPGVGVEIAGKAVPGSLAERYVPDVSRAKQELGLSQTVGMLEALRRTAEWAESL